MQWASHLSHLTSHPSHPTVSVPQCAAALFMSMMTPLLWVFSFFYDKIMFSYMNKE